MEDENYNYDDDIDIEYREDEIDYNPYDVDLQHQESFNIIHLNEMSSLREKIIADFIEKTYMERDDSIIALINYKWNLDKINDDWYNDVEGNRIKFGIDINQADQNLLTKEKIPKNSKYCLICYSDVDQNNSFSLKCQHKFCNDCWKDYLATKLDDLFCCVFSTCPQKGCNLTIPESIFCKYLENEKMAKEKYEKILLRNFTENNVDIRWCPRDCGKCVRTDIHYNKEIVCDCKYVYCFSCLREGHRPCFCDMVETWERKNNSEGENVKWLLVNTKQCPNCHKHIEKNQGCNHMTCRKEVGGCGNEFCWICMGNWKDHNNNYNCNKFDPKSEKKKEKIKNELDKYIHNFNRFINHKKSRDICIKNRDLLKNRMDYLFKNYNIPFIESNFLQEGLNTVERGRRVLMYTYVFGYYLDEKSKHKLLFEHNQTLLEKHCDFLHEKLEDESLNNILQYTDFDQFNKDFTNYKALITNYSYCTDKYVNSLISEIETKMMGDVIYKNN